MHSNIGRHYLKKFLNRIMLSIIVPANKNCGRNESQEKRTFDASEANNIRKFPWSWSAANCHGKTRQVLRAFVLVATFAKREPRVRKFFYTFFHIRQRFVVLKVGSISADGSQVCMARLSSYVGHYNSISSQYSNVFSQYSHGREIFLSKSCELRPYIHYKDTAFSSIVWCSLHRGCNSIKCWLLINEDSFHQFSSNQK